MKMNKDILEIGAGGLANCLYYPVNCHLTALEPNVGFKEFMNESIEKFV